jgi:hypothetical protein
MLMAIPFAFMEVAMRFSLKWILAGMAYAAVAAAAFSQETWVYADVLWAASLLAIVFAAILACFARGRRQIAAAGFEFASACFLLCLIFGDAGSVPTTRLLLAAGVGATDAPGTTVIQRPIVETRQTANGPVTQMRYVQEVRAVAVAAQPQLNYVPAAAPPAAGAWMKPTPAVPLAYAAPQPVDFSIYLRAGNAVGTMAFGLLGCVVGALAQRAVIREAIV